MGATCGTGFVAFARSMKKRPGSPLSHALCAILSTTSRASTSPRGSPFLGLRSVNFAPLFHASMNSSVRATLTLKFVICARSIFMSMNSMISGWSTRRIAMLAPRRVPPCLICSVAVLKIFMNDTGPEAMPPVEPTMSFLGRMRLKAKPVPPPVLWMIACCLIASKMPGTSSGTGSTKHAESCWSSRPAFMMVGELGRNLNVDMSS